jgi:glycosyltransferase involved in cell wall biosynthesis
MKRQSEFRLQQGVWWSVSTYSSVQHRAAFHMSLPAELHPKVSIVIPLYNEETNVGPLCSEMREVMGDVDFEYELILVDDGSTDATLGEGREAIRGFERARLIELRRNYGKSAALNAGFDHAEGDMVVTMDGDCQNDPRDIPALVGKLSEGFDVVSGWRQERKEGFIRLIPSYLANRLIGWTTGVPLHDYGCCLKAYRAAVLKDIRLYGEMHRFIPALIRWVGGEVTELPVNDRPRVAEKSKFNSLGRTVEVLLDLATVKFMMHYLTKPLYFFGRIGLLLMFMSFTVLALLVGQKLAYGSDMTGNPLLYLSITFLIISVQVFLMGLIMEVLTRTYHESQSRKMYAVRHTYSASCADGGDQQRSPKDA